MKRLFIAAVICLLAYNGYAQSYKRIHAKAIVVDTHNDILMKAADKGIVFDQELSGKTHSDLNRWKKADWMCKYFLCIAMVI